MKIDEFVTIKLKKIKPDTIEVTEKTRIWCQLPYSDKKQCPNYNKNPRCPPNSPLMLDLNTKYKNYYLLYCIFDLDKYLEKMIDLHDDWNEKQLKNVLFYQVQVKSIIKHELQKYYNVDLILGCGSGIGNYFSLESVGVNVYEMYKLNGIKFETKPKKRVVFSCLLCTNSKLSKIKQKGLI